MHSPETEAARALLLDDDALRDECDIDALRSGAPVRLEPSENPSRVGLFHRPTGLRVRCGSERSQIGNLRAALVELRAALRALAGA